MRAAGCMAFFWLVGGEVTRRCSRNLVLSLRLLSSPWVGALVPAEDLKNIVMYIPWGGTRTLPQGCISISWLFLCCFCIPSLLWLATVWTCPLELREGHGGWMKPISYKQEMGDTERLCTRESYRVLLGFNNKFSLLLIFGLVVSFGLTPTKRWTQFFW